MIVIPTKKLLSRSLLIAFVIITVFIFQEISFLKYLELQCFFRIAAGGILVAVIGYHMTMVIIHLAIKEWSSAVPRSKCLLLFLLCTPLFAGPGTITTALSLANGGLRNQLITVVAFAVNYV